MGQRVPMGERNHARRPHLMQVIVSLLLSSTGCISSHPSASEATNLECPEDPASTAITTRVVAG